MIKAGVATVYVSDLDRSVAFYADVLGLRLVQRWEDKWAMLDAGGFSIGLHPASPHAPAPGTSGSISIGFSVSRPIQDVVVELKNRGAAFQGDIHEDAEGGIRLAFFGDPDGNSLYLCEVVERW